MRWWRVETATAQRRQAKLDSTWQYFLKARASPVRSGSCPCRTLGFFDSGHWPLSLDMRGECRNPIIESHESGISFRKFFDLIVRIEIAVSDRGAGPPHLRHFDGRKMSLRIERSSLSVLQSQISMRLHAFEVTPYPQNEVLRRDTEQHKPRRVGDVTNSINLYTPHRAASLSLAPLDMCAPRTGARRRLTETQRTQFSRKCAPAFSRRAFAHAVIDQLPKRVADDVPVTSACRFPSRS